MSARPGSTLSLRARSAALLVLLVAGATHAGDVYQCVDAKGALAFQATPCAAHSGQTVMRIREQPLMDSEASRSFVFPGRDAGASSVGPRKPFHARAASPRSGAKRATSWECRAADGEVFYRHSHCPHSVSGDGVMRSTGTYAISRGRGGRTRTKSAWDPVPVHASKVPRAVACEQINAVAAVERDGSARDEHVSAYAHDLGRDPCIGY